MPLLFACSGAGTQKRHGSGTSKRSTVGRCAGSNANRPEQPTRTNMHPTRPPGRCPRLLRPIAARGAARTHSTTRTSHLRTSRTRAIEAASRWSTMRRRCGSTCNAWVRATSPPLIPSQSSCVPKPAAPRATSDASTIYLRRSFHEKLTPTAHVLKQLPMPWSP